MLKAAAVLIATFLGLGAVLFVWSNYTGSGQVDSCLDKGGAWNYAQGYCEAARPIDKGP